MIVNWRISNFKSIRAETELAFRPLTIFAGANSSGKSTVIQSILLVAQTLSYKIGTRPVVLNGALTSLGRFDDLKSNTSRSKKITISSTCRPIYEEDSVEKPSRVLPRGLASIRSRNQVKEIAFELSFGTDPSSSSDEIHQLQPQLLTTLLTCVNRGKGDHLRSSTIAINRATDLTHSEVEGTEDKSLDGNRNRLNLPFSINMDQYSKDEVTEDFYSAKPVGCTLSHFLPNRIICETNSIKETAFTITTILQDSVNQPIGVRRGSIARELLLTKEIISVLRDVLKDTIPLNEIFNLSRGQRLRFGTEDETPTIRDWQQGIRNLAPDIRRNILHALRDYDDLFIRIHDAINASSEESRQPDLVSVRPPRLITEATGYLDRFFTSSVKYLGPLRDAPKPLYPLTPTNNPDDVGLLGENTASVLELNKNTSVSYIPSANMDSLGEDNEQVTATLESAVCDWLQYLGVANTVSSLDQGKLGHALTVKLAYSTKQHDLTHVGVGVSQVLPILVMSLLASKDTTLIFEQPELHLHPKVQTLLGDFFLSMALSQKQCIVETHSEYLIERLRYRIAATPSEKNLHDLTKVYFVEKGSQSSHFNPVKINEFGAILDWPEGFFDESQKQSDRTLKAAMAKKRATRTASDA